MKNLKSDHLIKSPFEEIAVNIQTAAQDVSAKVKPALLSSIEICSEDLNQFFAELRNKYEKFPEELRIMVSQLSSIGWFISMETPINELFELKKCFDLKDYSKVDNYMSKNINNTIKLIRSELVENFPKRGKILQSAFNAHHDALYELSIPIFLAQADGICLELIGEKLFNKENGLPKTEKKIIKYDSNNFETSMLEPLRIVNPLSASEGDKRFTQIKFNRHEILHGISLDYANKINSLKSISLLYYLSSVVIDYLKDNMRETK